jgi:hypothetical protein
MGIDQEIRILDLLAVRDAEFLRVRECEDKIRQILGGHDFPFPAPPVTLPSASRKGKPTRFPGVAVVANGSKKPPRPPESSSSGDGADCTLVVPPLDPATENAYRIVFQDKGETKVSYLQSTRDLQEMLRLACPTFQITCLETVLFHTLDDYQAIRRIL